MDKIKSGVIGLGHNGRAFCDIYSNRDDCELAAVCDLDSTKVQDALGHVLRFNRYFEIIKKVPFQDKCC